MDGIPKDSPDLDDLFPDASTADAAWIRRRERFYERAIGRLRQPSVYHWEDDRNPHVDVYAIRAPRPRTSEFLVTGGAADRPLPGIPPGDPRPRRVELLVELPKAEAWAAMILREIAAVAFALAVPLFDGGLIEGSREIAPGSRLHHALLVAERSRRLAGFVVDGEEVAFLRVLFLTREELDYAKVAGPDRLLARLEMGGATGVQDVGRESVV